MNRTRYPAAVMRSRPQPEMRLEAVIAVQQEVATAELDLEHIMQLVTRRTRELTHAMGAVVEMVEGDEMVYRSVSGLAESFLGLRLRAGQSLSGLCVAERRVLVSTETRTDPRVDGEACRRIGVRSMIVVPLLHRDRAVGVLKVMSAEPDGFADEDASTLQLMAGLIAAAIAHAAAMDEQAEELRRTNALVHAIMNVSPDVIYVKDRQSRMKYFNRATLDLVGKPAEEVLGKNDVEFLGPEGDPILANDRRIMERGETEVFEELVPVKGQPPRVFLSTKSPHRDERGAIVGLIGISKDITERKQAEARLHVALSELESHRAQLEAVFQAVKDGIVVFDRAGRVVLLNDAEAEICGYASADDMKRDLEYFSTVFELFEIGGPQIPVEDWPVSHVLRGHSVRDRQLRGRRTDTGREWYFSFSGEPVHDEDGENAMAVLITRDITAHKEAELGLRENAERLREAVRARDEFFSVASHELKTPLTSLQLQLETLRRRLLRADELGAERVLKFAEQSAHQTARLGQLVDDMLDISRIASGRFSIDASSMDLGSTVSEVVERLRPQLEAANGSVRVSCEAVVGRWDRHRIEQVISNLLTNAMRYGKGAPVEVCLERRGDLAHLVISDHGIGVAPDDHERIFGRFERAISANEVSGLGLGLFISRQIVEAHRGRIWVESEPGHGSRFHVQLPL